MNCVPRSEWKKILYSEKRESEVQANKRYTERSSNKNEHYSSSKDDKKVKSFNVSVREALALYTEGYPDATITSLVLEEKRGNYFYVIEGAYDEWEYSLEVSSYDGSYTHYRAKRLDSDENSGRKRDMKR